MDKPEQVVQDHVQHVEDIESWKEDNYQKAHALEGSKFTGAVQLADGDVTFLIPTPSSDPRGRSSAHEGD